MALQEKCWQSPGCSLPRADVLGPPSLRPWLPPPTDSEDSPVKNLWPQHDIEWPRWSRNHLPRVRMPCSRLRNPGAPHSSEADITAETHREGRRGPHCVPGPAGGSFVHAMSLCRCTFMRPAEEGSVFSRYQEKKGVAASATEPGQPRPVLCRV